MTAKRSRKIRAQRVDPAEKLARTIVPAAQVRSGAWELTGVANRTDADQRDMESLKRTQTIRRTPKLMQLVNAKTITKAEALTCQWYADRHTEGFHTTGTTANYGGAGGGGCSAYTHLAKHKAQMIARQEYAAARAAIAPGLIVLFERVVLHGRSSRLGLAFRLAIRQLDEHLIAAGIAP
jgi:hypothetical protein